MCPLSNTPHCPVNPDTRSLLVLLLAVSSAPRIVSDVRGRVFYTLDSVAREASLKRRHLIQGLGRESAAVLRAGESKWRSRSGEAGAFEKPRKAGASEVG